MRLITTFAGASALALIAACPALAQDAPPEVAEVVVTGSFIRGTPEDAALPVDVISSEELAKQGSPTMVEMIKSLTASNGVLGESNQFTGGGRGQAGEGAGSVNLRGLGPQRTLILLNGHRLASDDTNALPMTAIGRVEVLKDGAASTYGSDAIGGVVNFITKKNFTGLEMTADYRFIDGSDGDYSVGLTAGKAWDRFDVLVSAGYQHKSDLPVVERDWALREFQENPEATWSTGSSPMSFIPVGSAFTPTGAKRADVGCVPLGGIVAADGVCRTQPLIWDNIVDATKSAQIYGEVNFDVTDNLKFHAEGMYAYTELTVNTTPSYTTSRPITETVLPEGFLDVPTWNTPSPDSPAGSNFFYVPLTNPGFSAYCASNPGQCPAGTTGGVIQIANWRPFLAGGNPLFDYGPSILYRERRQARFSASLDGDLGRAGFLGDVGFTLNSTYGRYESERYGYDTLTGRLELALRGLGGPACPWQNAANAGNGALGCYYLNPFSNGIPGNPVLGLGNPGFDPAVENTNRELLSWMFTRADESYIVQEVIETNLVFNGQSAIQLPGGAIGWAVGGQWLRTLYTSDPDPRTSNIDTPCPDTPITGSTSCFPKPTSPYVFLGNLNPQDLKRDSYALFGELNAPITDSLNVVLAARYEDFGDQGGETFNPKLSVRWQALDWLAFRGSVGTTFRAPPLTSLTPDTGVSLQNVFGTFRPVEVTGNPLLEPEEAFTYSVGAILNVGNFRATIDYWDFKLEKLLTSEPLQAVLSVAFPTGAETCDASDPFIAQHFTFSGPCSAANVASVKTLQINGPDTTTSGIDILATYQFDDVLGGRAEIGGSLSYVLDYTVAALVIDGVTYSPETDAVGYANFGNSLAYPMPEWKAEVYGEYTRGGHNLRWTIRYIDDYTDQRVSQFISGAGNQQASPTPQTSPLVVTYSGRKIQPYIQHDLAYRVELPWDTTATFTVQNVFDRDPSFARTELSYDALTSNPLGRTFKVGVRKRF